MNNSASAAIIGLQGSGSKYVTLYRRELCKKIML